MVDLASRNSTDKEMEIINIAIRNTGTMTILILCTTFFLVLVVYWIMPTKKMKEVNKALISLLQILPVTKAIDALTKNKNVGKTDK